MDEEVKMRFFICQKDDGGWYWVQSDEPQKASAGELARSWNGRDIPVSDRSECPYKTEEACRAALKEAWGEDVTIEVATYQGAAPSTVEDGRPPKPPWHRLFKDRNWKAAKFLSKAAIPEAIVEFIKWWLSGRKCQPAQR